MIFQTAFLGGHILVWSRFWLLLYNGSKIVISRPILFFILVAVAQTFERWAFGSWSYVPLQDEGDSALPFRLIQGREFFTEFFAQWSRFYGGGLDRYLGQFNSELDALPYAVLPGWAAYGFNNFIVVFVENLVSSAFRAVLRLTVSWNQ